MGYGDLTTKEARCFPLKSRDTCHGVDENKAAFHCFLYTARKLCELPKTSALNGLNRRLAQSANLNGISHSRCVCHQDPSSDLPSNYFRQHLQLRIILFFHFEWLSPDFDKSTDSILAISLRQCAQWGQEVIRHPSVGYAEPTNGACLASTPLWQNA